MDILLNQHEDIPMKPSWRKPAGAFAILAIIALDGFLIGSASPWISRWPLLAQAVTYTFAGLIWIAPLKPLLLWMETGAFTPKP
jgi:Protein of unknown function (DUF2842)